MAVSRVLFHWPEMDQRRRKWMTVAESVEAVEEPELKRLLEKFGRDMRGN